MRRNIALITISLSLFACSYNKDAQNTEMSLFSASGDRIENLIKSTSDKPIFKDSLPYQIVKFYRETKRNTNPVDSSKYAYMRASYPKFGAVHKFLNNKISAIVSAEPWTGNKAYNIEKAAEFFFKEYFEFSKEIPDSPAGYSSDNDILVISQDTNLVVLRSESYIYTGGAHGLESIIYYNMDIKGSKELTLKDLLVDNYSNRLTNIAEEIFRKDEGLTASESLEHYFFENQIFTINENFAITHKGLLFTYNPYEIKSYAEGITDLLIPYSKIKELIKPNSFISKYVN